MVRAMGEQPSVSFPDFLDQADTGDVVIWTGTSMISEVVELATWSDFSHTSMVICDPNTGDKYLLQSVSEALAPDPLTKPPGNTHTGVQAGALEDVMEIVYKYGDLPTWRQLNWPNRPSSLNSKVWQIAQGMDGTPFPWIGGDSPTPEQIAESIVLMGGLLLLGREFNQEVTNPIFCSGLVAYILQNVGVIQKTMAVNGYEPKDFSSKYPGVVQPSTGVSFNPDVWIQDIPPPPTKK
jgi:hypothetical protein